MANYSHEPKIRFDEEEIEIIRKYYPTEGPKVCKRLKANRRTPASCSLKALQLGLRTSYPRSIFGPEQDEILRKYYPTEGNKVAERPGMEMFTPQQCNSRAAALGIASMARAKPWTEEELELLKKYYPQNADADEFAEVLKNHSTTSCWAKARNLGLCSCIQKRWTPDEDAILMEHYPTEGKEVMTRLPQRTLTACYMRARKLGLRRDGGQGRREDDAS